MRRICVDMDEVMADTLAEHLRRADFLIDGQPCNLEKFAGQGLLYAAPHNLAVTGFARMENWFAVKRYFSPMA